MKNELSFSVHTKKDSALKTQSLVIEGELTINNAEAFRQKLLSTEFKYDLNIKLQNIDTMDLTCIQIISSLIKTLEVHGLKSSIESEFPERIMTTLKNNGLSNLIKS